MNEWISEYLNEKNSSSYDEKLSISSAINLGASDYKWNGSIESIELMNKWYFGIWRLCDVIHIYSIQYTVQWSK